MLFTRCPHCETTFRITPEALDKAAGQVRCGRCTRVFDATSHLSEELPGAAHETPPVGDRSDATTSAHGATSSQPDETGAPREARDEDAATSAARAHSDPDIEADWYAAADLYAEGDDVHETRDEAREPPRARPSTEGTPSATDLHAGDDTETAADAATRDAADGPSATDLHAGDDTETAPDAAARDAADGPSATDADDEAEMAAAAARARGVAISPTTWWIEDEAPARSRALVWGFAASAAALVLAAQLVHAFRSELVSRAGVGPVVAGVYNALGVDVVPDWDVTQYRIVDWVATASSASGGSDSLLIRAEIENRGPDAQPYPHVSLELKDRWDAVVGRRVFEPELYLSDDAHGSSMAAGETVVAVLDVVDPGPDAYGFELDVCVRAQESELRCAGDAVFR